MNFGDIPENALGNVSAFCQAVDLSRLSSCSMNLRSVVFGATLALFHDVFRLPIDHTMVILPKFRKDVYRLLERSRSYDLAKQSSEVISFACACGYTEFLKEYLGHFSGKQIIELNIISDRNGFLPIHLSAMNGHHQIVELLLNKKIYVDQCDANMKTPLWYACRGAHPEVIQVLISHGCNISHTPSCLIVAINSGSKKFQNILACINKLVTHFVNLPKCMLIEAVHEGMNKSGEILQSLLSPIIQSNCIDSIRKSNPNLSTLLIAAVRSNKIHTMEVLISSGLSVWTDCCLSRKSALFVASELGYLAMTTSILKMKCPINMLTSTQRNPLHIAVERGHCEIVELLCEKATMDDILQPNSSDVTPLTLAENKGRLRMLMSMIGVYQKFKQSTYTPSVYIPRTYLDRMVLKYSRPRTAILKRL